MHWPDPTQRPRIAEIGDNLTARIAESEYEGWLGEAEGLKSASPTPKTISPRSTPHPPRRHRPRHSRSRPATPNTNRQSDLSH